MKCSKCNNESDTVMTFINAQTGKTDFICDKCLVSDFSPEIKDINEIDKQIALIEKGLETGRYILEHAQQPDISDYDKDFSSMLFTPSKVFNMLSKYHDDYLNKREKILKSMSEKDRLSYELKKALDNEDYETAAEIRNKINGLIGE